MWVRVAKPQGIGNPKKFLTGHDSAMHRLSKRSIWPSIDARSDNKGSIRSGPEKTEKDKHGP